MSAGPEVSVVISCRNRQAMLWDCFRGLAAQTLARSRFEVVLLDNVSTDDLASLAERARRDHGLSVVFERMAEDHGPAPARNRGVALAHAPVIAFTDSDCRPEPRWLEAGLAAFADPAVALASGPVLPKPEQSVRTTSKLTFATAEEHPSFPTANAWYRRDVFLSQGGFDTALSFRDPLGRAVECADADLAWKVIKAGHARRFVPEAVVRHEIEELGVFGWLLEPTRVFALPALVQRHPELRGELLTAGVFFYPTGTLRLAAVFVLAIAAFWWPWLLLLPVMALFALAALRTRGSGLRPMARHMAKTVGELVRHFVLFATLLYGSIRFRSLVI